MDLILFKDFYLNCFPNAKEESTNKESKRINNSLFLSHMLGDQAKIICSYLESDISKVMNGNPPSKFVKSFNTQIIESVSKVINKDIDGINIKNIIEEAKTIFKVENNDESSKIYNIISHSYDINDLMIGIKWWFILVLLQNNFNSFYKEFSEETQDIINRLPKIELSSSDYIDTFLKKNGISVCLNGKRKSAEIPYKCFHELRRILIDNATEKLYISGSTLGDAFSNAKNGDVAIIKNLANAINTRRIKEINVYIMDPGVLGEPNLSDPIGLLNANINSLIDNLHRLLKSNNCKLNIFFLPFFDIDHVVLTSDVMLYRTTKLWTRERNYKGSIMLFHKSYIVEDDDPGEYNAQQKYFNTLFENSVEINTDQTIEIDPDMPNYLKTYYEIRNSVYKLHNIGNYQISLFKVYNTQLKRFIVSSFKLDKNRFKFTNKHIDLFKPENLLNDKTQSVLLPYIKNTESMLNSVIKKYDKRSESGVCIIPSLDLGYPNNIVRLAGGFATGMLIDWECGTPIIPIDATVNVCSSSVFKINPTDELLNNFSSTIKSIKNDAVSKCGYTFSFTSGNHFLMIATDENDDYYLVLHSSAKEMKESYSGLYPKEYNWYSSKVKTMRFDNGYIRYIKGNEAEYFIKTAHHFEQYNEEIHRWIARQFNWIESDYSNIKHHYYMPTDSSIAIGTFAERPGVTVPIFSNVGKPVYLFEIGADNWMYDLGGRKGEVCVVPHGWGQQIENVTNLFLDDGKLCFKLRNNEIIDYRIFSTERIGDELNSETNIEYNKMVRNFDSIEDFFKKGNNYIKGIIKKVLTPNILYCKSTLERWEDRQ